MKKIMGILIATLLLSVNCFAQKINGELEVRVGGNFQFTPVLGELSDYVSSSIGGGIKAEIDLPVYISDVLEIGVPVNAGFGGNPIKNDLLKSMFNIQFSSGIYGRIMLFDDNFIIQPELDYGMVLTLPTVNKTYPNELDSVYADQSIQFVLGFRYAPQAIDFGMLEFELAPLYTLCLENNNLVHYLGGRLGVMIRVF